MQYPQEESTSAFLQAQFNPSLVGHFVASRPRGETSSANYIEVQAGRNWTRAELQSFALFLHLQCGEIEFGDVRKANRIFALMSKYVKTRNLNQCRNFSLKMVRRYGSQQKVKQLLAQLLPNWQKIKGESLIEIEKPEQSNGQTAKMAKREGFRCVDSMHFRGEIGFECFSQGKEQQLKPTDSEYHLQNNENVCYGKSRRQQSHLLIDPEENKDAQIYSELSKQLMAGFTMRSGQQAIAKAGINWRAIDEKE